MKHFGDCFVHNGSILVLVKSTLRRYGEKTQKVIQNILKILAITYSIKIKIYWKLKHEKIFEKVIGATDIFCEHFTCVYLSWCSSCVVWKKSDVIMDVNYQIFNQELGSVGSFLIGQR